VVDGPLGVIGGAAVGGVIGNQIGKRQDEKS
jgi:outer membrane lipoprotein SlyB